MPEKKSKKNVKIFFSLFLLPLISASKDQSSLKHAIYILFCAAAMNMT